VACDDLLGDAPAPPQPMPQKIRRKERAVASAGVTASGKRNRPRGYAAEANSKAKTKRLTTNQRHRFCMGDVGTREIGIIWDAARVLMLTVNGAGLPLDTDKVAGTVHVAPKGAPEQVNASVPLKPGPGVAWSLNCAVWPAERVAVVDEPEAGVIDTAVLAVPLMERDCGELGALSVRVSVVVRMPVAVGEKTIEMVQEAFAGMEPLQVSAEMLKSEELKPLRTALSICKGAAPELVRVTVCGDEVMPCVDVPGKVRAEAGFRVTPGELGGGATEVPVSKMNWGLPAALSVTKRVA
jgi:hypothetical protein